jgi:hypothetical protein
MEVKGKIIAVQPLQSGEGRNGLWQKQEYVIEYDHSSQYPRKLMFNLWGDKIDEYKIQQGETLRVSVDIDCREYNGRWYNDIRAWRVERDETASPLPADVREETPPFASPGSESGALDATSDLPF